jgi:hypothetical protein
LHFFVSCFAFLICLLQNLERVRAREKDGATEDSTIPAFVETTPSKLLSRNPDKENKKKKKKKKKKKRRQKQQQKQKQHLLGPDFDSGSKQRRFLRQRNRTRNGL